jgi:hypothetical protein
MIAPKNHLPLLELPDGTLAPFERSWVEGSIRLAARNAGYQAWWLACPVSESVIEYFATRIDETIVPISRIIDAIREVLRAIGYRDIARKYQPGPPPLRISLAELARDAGTGYELAFFRLLDENVRLALVSAAESIRFDQLKGCVKRLRASKTWQRDCRALQDEIIAHLRARLMQAGSVKGLSVTH